MSVHKIFVDSRYRTSGTVSDFVYDLPQPVDLPQNKRAFITDLLVPVSWYTVPEGATLRYSVENLSPGFGSMNGLAQLVSGNYTRGEDLSDMLQTALNNSFKTQFPNIEPFICAYDRVKNKLTIGIPGGVWKVIDQGSGFSIKGDPILDVIIPEQVPETLSQNHVFSVDLRRIHAVVITSAELAGERVALGPFGSMSAIRRIPISVDYGKIQHFEGYAPSDAIDVGGRLLSRLHFRVCSVRGETIELNDIPIQFSIVFE